MKQVDVAETLINEADAFGEDLEFDSDGNLVSGTPEPTEAE